MTYFGNKDFFLEVARGNVSGMVSQRVLGRNPSIGTTQEFLWEVGGTYNFLQTAATLRIASGGDAADDVAGLGAQEVSLTFLTSTGALTTEALDTAGASASAATSVSASRLILGTISEVGAYGVGNTGDIMIETSGGTTVGRIVAGVGITRLALYTVPLNKTAYLYRIRTHVEGNKDLSFHFYYRESVLDAITPFSPRIEFLPFDEQVGGASDGFNLVTPLKFSALTDVWVEGVVSSGSAAGSAVLEFLIVDD